MRSPARLRALVGSFRLPLLTLTLATAIVAGGLSLHAVAQPAPAQPAVGALQPSNKRVVIDRNISKAVTYLLNREHLTRQALDNMMSERAFTLFIKQLDPMKLYFYQSDIDEFAQQKTDLDDLAKNGDMSFAYKVYNRLLERVDERVALVSEILSKPLDFSADETLKTDPDKVSFARSKEEAYSRWEKRLKYDMLVLRADKENTADPVERLKRRYNSFAKRMKQTDGDELLEMFLTAITTSFDPHTTYMSPSTLENFDIQMRLGLEGIGAALQLTDGYTVISKIIPGGAADKGGELKEGDRIISVGQNDGASGTDKMVDVVDMKLNDVVALIRGKAGTVVRLGVIPKGGTESKVINITRASIKLTDSEARAQIIEDGKKTDGSSFRVGVIDLPSFYMDMEGARNGVVDFKSTTRDVRVLLDDFNKKKVDCVVLDLRRNGGGSLTEAVNLTGLFIDEGPVVQVKGPRGEAEHYDDMDRGMTWKGPLVVLTSKFSASASEIFAGAIQDYHRGIVVGDSQTHGKGSVQSLRELGRELLGGKGQNLGALKITMQKFYRPNGDSTQMRGVLADVVLPSLTDNIEGISEKDLDYALKFDNVPANTFSKYNQVTSEIKTQLQSRSAERIRTSDDFKKIEKVIARYKEQATTKEVPLNEEKFAAQRKEIDAERELEKQYEEQVGGNKTGDVVKRDAYFNEVLAIARDYVQLLGQNTIARAN
jgi:carboxyl-terminal processing protease